MVKVNCLILLVNSLSKAEKKSIYLHSDLTNGSKLYLELFQLIEKKKITDSSELAEEFGRKFSKASFHPIVKYLYEFILNVLVKLKSTQDKEFALYQKILSAKILHERNLASDYYSTLQQLQDEAEMINNYHLLLIVRRMELDYLRTTGFEDISEKDLLKKQHKVNDALKVIRQINEQSSLYELLLLRIEKTSDSQSSTQKQFLYDLVVSEITLASNLKRDVFEVQKLHQLFQAHYLIHVGDYKSALNSFKELDKLFNNNKVLWNNPPLYYVTVLEGVLGSLKAIDEYDQMEYFLDKLRKIDHSSIPFLTEVSCIEFVYTISIYMHQKNAPACLDVIEQFKDKLISKRDLLTPYRVLQLSLTLSLIYFKSKKYSEAKKQLSSVVSNESFANIWLFRPIQLVNLIINYELGEFDSITSSIRSIKRKNRISRKTSKLENLLFRFLSLDLIMLNPKKKESEKKKYQDEFELIKNNEERRFLSVFNFEKWILEKFEKS